jgi:hypothetical protein
MTTETNALDASVSDAAWANAVNGTTPIEEAAPEPALQGSTEAEPVATEPEAAKPDHRVPVSELIAERKRRQELEAERSGYEARLAAYEVMHGRAPQRQPEPEQDPFDAFADNPSEFVRTQFQKVYGPQILALQRDNAALSLGKDKVDAAEAAFMKAFEGETLSQAEYAEVANADNRYAAAVKWHQRRTLLETTGGDIDAFQRNYRESLLKDPEFVRQAIEGQRGGQQPGAAAPIKSTFKLPGSITNIGTTKAAATDTSADEVWARAVNRR